LVLNYHQCRHWQATLAAFTQENTLATSVLHRNENNYIVAGFTCIPVRGLNPTAEFAMTAFLGVTYACKFHPTFNWNETQICIHAETCHIFVAVCLPPHSHQACYKPHSHLALLKINWQTSWDNISWQRETPTKKPTRER
jgi:hypothetical protein